jgi:predicted amidohydrolase
VVRTSPDPRLGFELRPNSFVASEVDSLSPDLVVFGELTLCGYPPEDLVLKGAFLDACEAAVGELAAETQSGPALLVGAPWRVMTGCAAPLLTMAESPPPG